MVSAPSSAPVSHAPVLRQTAAAISSADIVSGMQESTVLSHSPSAPVSAERREAFVLSAVLSGSISLPFSAGNGFSVRRKAEERLCVPRASGTRGMRSVNILCG